MIISGGPLWLHREGIVRRNDTEVQRLRGFLNHSTSVQRQLGSNVRLENLRWGKPLEEVTDTTCVCDSEPSNIYVQKK